MTLYDVYTYRNTIFNLHDWKTQYERIFDYLKLFLKCFSLFV